MTDAIFYRIIIRCSLAFVFALSAILGTSCQSSTAPKANQSGRQALPESSGADSLFASGSNSNKAGTRILHIDSKTLSFINPGTGDVFSLHLGDSLTHETGGITEVPRNIKIGYRGATSSFWEPESLSGDGYACAESSYSKDCPGAAYVAKSTNVQYQPASGRLLITEDTSDALPCRRYILYTPFPHGGYEVRYLAPILIVPPNHIPENPELIPDILLLPGGRAEINGKTLKVDDIAHSPNPFSIGP